MKGSNKKVTLQGTALRPTGSGQFPANPRRIKLTQFFEHSHSNTEASLLTTILDFPGQQNFFRVIVRNGSTSTPFVADSWFNDQISSNGRITIGSRFAFERGDTAISTVYHISKEFHDFLRSARTAQNPNNSPFGQPSSLVSNIKGGIGIFTTISETRDTLFVK